MTDSSPVETPPAPAPKRRRKGKLRRILKWAMILLVLAGIGGCVRGIMASRSSDEETPLKDPIKLERGAVAERAESQVGCSLSLVGQVDKFVEYLAGVNLGGFSGFFL